MNTTTETTARMRRRGLVAAAATLVAGIAATRTTTPVAAGGTQGTALICGDNTNTATQVTALTPTMNPFIGFQVDNSNQGQNPGGRGIRGIGGTGVEGLGSGVGVAGQGLSNGSTGVSGTMAQGVTSGTGVAGTADLYGVSGTASGTFGAGVIGSGTGSSSSGVSGNGRFGVIGGGTGIGVYGVGNASGATGVAGQGAGAGPGVSGSSPGNHGVVGSLDATTAGKAGVYGTGASTGTYGVRGNNSGSDSIGVYGSATSGYGVVGNAAAGDVAALYGSSSGANTPAFAAFNSVAGGLAGSFNGKVYITGDFIATGGVKSAAVPHPDGSHRLLYCVESPESWFEDFGDGTLTGGKAEVKLDPDFATVVDTSTLHVFLTSHDEHQVLHLTGRSTSGFTVSASPSQLAVGKKQADLSGTFTWRVVAKRKDVAAPRLAKVDLPTVPAPPPPPPPEPKPKAPELPKPPKA